MPSDYEYSLMARFYLSEVRSALGHPWTPNDQRLGINGVQFDSRRAESGDLFVALSTKRRDGNKYIGDAFRRGAVAAIVERIDPAYPDAQQIVVPDSQAALANLGSYFRDRAKNSQFIGITGSNGKTTTKEALAAVLGTTGSVVKSQKSFNNELGIPVTLSETTPDTTYTVLEMGAQFVGEIKSHCELARPHHGIITNIGRAHLGMFGSPQNLVRTKAELAQYLNRNGILILNANDSATQYIAKQTKARVAYFGSSSNKHTTSSDVHTASDLSGQDVRIESRRRRGEVHVKAIGRHLGQAFSAAIALGLELDLDFDDLLDGLSTFEPIPHRMQIHRALETTIIDDTYNANRDSCLYALAELQQAHPQGRRIAILGDMLELGRFSAEDHAAVGAEAGFVDRLITIGEQASLYGEKALASGLDPNHYRFFPADIESTDASALALETAGDFLRNELRPGDVVLIKGSNALQLSRLVDQLITES